jgi:hypothetical protein
VFADVLPIATFRRAAPPVDGDAQPLPDRGTGRIHRASGVIDKYMGNEIMGVFNSQLSPLENHARKAVEAALDMRDAFALLYTELGVDPSASVYRIGMHTGVATLGNVGSFNRRDFSAIGDSINLSHRLLENATANQVLVSDDTRLHIEREAGSAALPLRFESRGSIQVKGEVGGVSYEVPERNVNSSEWPIVPELNRPVIINLSTPPTRKANRARERVRQLPSV